jgi:uncharacterized membrane protein YdjX (TVP38/TMEM64 family)
MANPSALGHYLWTLHDSPWAIPLILAAYVLASATLFPNTVLNAATILAFGSFEGPPAALAGSLTAALVFYWVGRGPGHRRLRRMNVAKVEHVNRQLRRGGVAGMVTLRLLPIAPFMVVNVLAGAARVSPGTFAIGTLIGLLPGCLLVTAFGHQLRRMIANPEPREVLILATVSVAAIAVLWGLQRVCRPL